ncbi:MAG: hypothetical protein ABL970_18110 [Nitrospira sp.]
MAADIELVPNPEIGQRSAKTGVCLSGLCSAVDRVIHLTLQVEQLPVGHIAFLLLGLAEFPKLVPGQVYESLVRARSPLSRQACISA